MKQILLTLTLIISFQCRGQITFINETTPWETLSKTAAKEKKLIFIHLEGNECEQCNEVASKGFSGPDLKDVYQKSFISIRSNVTSENGRKLAEKFQIKGALVSLYIDAEGNILNQFRGSTSNSKVYLEHAQAALNRKGGKQLSDFEKEYKNGERSAKFLKAYIQKRREVNLPANDLLDEYVGKLPVDSLMNFQLVKFIYQNGPTLDSRAYKVVQALVPYSMIDSLYKSVPPHEASAFNGGIIGNTMRKAIETKNQNLAYQSASFLQNTYQKDFRNARLAFERTMIQYHFGVKDTMAYFSQTRNFIDHNHLLLSIDSLKRMDDDMMKKSLASQTPLGPAGEKQAIRFAPPSQRFHIELNEHAWHFYELNNNPRDLERALMWSKRSMEWHEELRKDKQHLPLGNPAYIDTYARLLYKLGRKDEAIEWQTKAVEAQKVSGMSWVSMEKDLNEMKAGTLKW
jgi:thioredoxin-related protein